MPHPNDMSNEELATSISAWILDAEAGDSGSRLEAERVSLLRAAADRLALIAEREKQRPTGDNLALRLLQICDEWDTDPVE